MYRFYCANANFKQSTVIINDPDEIHHIKDVLRLHTGAFIQIFNAQSQEADVVIERMSEAGIAARVKEVRQESQGGVRIVLACAPPKKGKFELIIEKATELGVEDIIPLKTKRTEVVFEGDKMAAKLSRFERIAVNAAKQSKRVKVPRVHPMASLPQVLQSLDPSGIHLIPSLNGRPRHIKEALSKASVAGPITIFIGPEGDFTPQEVKLALDHGCVPVSLGPTVLKVETAAIATVVLVRFLYVE